MGKAGFHVLLMALFWAITSLSQAAELKIYAYDAPNPCPEGLQPVTMSGAISCGIPNQQKQRLDPPPSSTTKPVMKKKVTQKRKKQPQVKKVQTVKSRPQKWPVGELAIRDLPVAILEIGDPAQ